MILYFPQLKFFLLSVRIAGFYLFCVKIVLKTSENGQKWQEVGYNTSRRGILLLRLLFHFYNNDIPIKSN